MERSSQRQPNLGVAVPAEIDDGAFGGEQVERALETLGGRARVHDQVEIAGGIVRQREVDVESRGDVGAPGIDVDQRDAHRRMSLQQPGDATAHHPAAHDGDPVPDCRGGIPQRVDGGLDRAGEHRPSRAVHRPARPRRPLAGTTYAV